MSPLARLEALVQPGFSGKAGSSQNRQELKGSGGGANSRVQSAVRTWSRNG